MKIPFLNCILLLIISFSCHGYAQVGINIQDSQNIFHLDPKKDTNGTVNTSDDFVVTNDGRVGVGTISPSADKKIDIEGDSKISGNSTNLSNKIVDGAGRTNKIGISVDNPTHPIHISASSGKLFKLSDTSEDSGSLLTVGAGGNVYWEGLKPMSSLVQGALTPGVVINNAGAGIDITSKRLELSPGKWFIFARAVTQGNLAGFAMYILLYDEVNGALARTAGYAQPGSPYTAVINMTYVVDIPYNAAKSTRSHWINLSCSSSNGTTTNSVGDMTFYALRIDRDN